ncbi:phosphoenolpyruvate--protein phosphotransferase [Acidobacteriota bacterium]
MKILKGKTISSGIAKGVVNLYLNEHEESVPHYGIDETQIPNEIERLKQAFKKAKSLMNEMIDLSTQSSDEQAAEIVNVHLMILNDPKLFFKIEKLIIKNKINAEHAINDIFNEYIELHKKKHMHFQELVHDFMDVRDRLLSFFSQTSGHFENTVNDCEPVIVATKRLNSHLVLNIPRDHVLAFVTLEGGYTTHAAILARSLDIPVIFGIDVKKELSCGIRAIIDGMTGKVIISPDEATEKYYDKKVKQYRIRRQFCEVRSHLKAKTKTNVRITLKVNISNPGEMELIGGLNHDGIGLLRTEFLFLDREHPPSEEEQYKMYRTILQRAEGKLVVVRLLDVGSDKLPLFLDLPDQTNPDLEIRGSRAVDYFYGIYLTQAKAILRASQSSEMKILYPMVSDMSDVKTFKSLIADAKKKLREEGQPHRKSVKDGIMIETPAAALLSDQLLRQVDFANIGSNDLLQYTLAASRGNPIVEEKYHILHPAMVKLMEMTIRAGKKHNKEICLCGEVASFEEYYPLFLKIGLRCFSVAAMKFPAIKCDLMHVSINRSSSLKKEVYEASSKKTLDKLFKKTL